jgi:hypothetical protein
MRNVLILSFVALAAFGATGCMSRNTCNPCGGGGGWYPGKYLFGGRNEVQAAPVCCDPCAGGAMLGAPVMSAPVMTAAPCCQ